MAIRFPDLQVLFSRATDIGKIQPPAEQQNQTNLHAEGERMHHMRERRNETVATSEESERAALRARKEKADGKRGRKRKGKPSGESDRGRHLDIEV